MLQAFEVCQKLGWFWCRFCLVDPCFVPHLPRHRSRPLFAAPGTCRWARYPRLKFIQHNGALWHRAVPYRAVQHRSARIRAAPHRPAHCHTADTESGLSLRQALGAVPDWGNPTGEPFLAAKGSDWLWVKCSSLGSAGCDES